MIIDTNLNLSRWPFRRTPCDEIAPLLKRLQMHHVEQAWAGSLDGVFHRDVGGVNLRLHKECASHTQLIPFGTVNPTLPDWEEDLRRCQEDYRMPGIRLHPNFHGYTLDDARFQRLLQLAEQRRLLVQLALRMDDTRVQHHLMQVADVDPAPLLKVLPKTPNLKLMLINALRTTTRPSQVALSKAGNVHFEISMLEGVGGVSQLLQALPLERLHFGSHLPLFVIESAVLKLQESPLTPTQLAAISRDNARQLLSNN